MEIAFLWKTMLSIFTTVKLVVDETSYNKHVILKYNVICRNIY